MMEDLCVKMSRLSLDSDAKLEAYDAKLDRFFNEEKVDLSRDEKNQETFEYNDDSEYSLEVCAFNTRFGTDFTSNKLVIFLDYAEHTGLTIEDAFDYCQSCHACGEQLKEFCGEYCNRRCAEEVENWNYKCLRGDDCLICVGYPQTTCYWGPNCNECDAYEGPEEERYPFSCFHCLTQMTDHEGYQVENELYCNNCAVDLFDKTGHLEQDSKKRTREPEEEQDEEKSSDQMCDLTDESCDIWELALDINNGDKEAALQMIEDQERLMAHPRIIEYYRAKQANACSNVEECSSEYSSIDEDLQERKRARHIRFEDVDESEVMVIDLISQDDNVDDYDVDDYDVDDYDVEDYDYVVDPMVIDLSQDEDYDYAESVVDDDESEEEAVTNSVTMSQTVVSSMVTMIQELRDENEALRHELELLRGQRCMLFPEGSSISFTDEDGQRYLNIHAASPYAYNQAPLTMADLEGDLEANSDDSDDNFAMDEDN
jgi:hypothetical protein